MSSADPPGTTPRLPASTGLAEPAATDAAGYSQAPGPADHRADDTARAHAHKLEQIKDLYLTAEAIGETNVDKHFDQLLAQQRELISEYFRQSSAARPAGEAVAAMDQGAVQARMAPGGPGDREDHGPAGGPSSAPEGARIAADQPGAW